MIDRQAYDPIRAFVARVDPELVRAVDDVDVALLEWGLSLSPWERLRAASGALQTLSKFRRVETEDR